MQSLDSNRLSLTDAARAMAEFVWRFANRSNSDELLTLLGDTDISIDGSPWDPASWFDWLASVDWIRAGNPPQSGADQSGEWWIGETREFEPRSTHASDDAATGLSLPGAFMAMTEYLWRVANSPDKNAVTDVLHTLKTFDTAAPGSSSSSSFWNEWLECVEWILAGNAPQTGPDETRPPTS